MSKLLSLPRSQWQSYFDRVSKALLGKRAEIEVASLELGDQIAAEWLQMIGITYDSRDDLLDVALEGTDHLIQHPKEITVEEGADGLASVAVIDQDGARQIIRLKDPLTLPAAPVNA